MHLPGHKTRSPDAFSTPGSVPSHPTRRTPRIIRHGCYRFHNSTLISISGISGKPERFFPPTGPLVEGSYTRPITLRRLVDIVDLSLYGHFIGPEPEPITGHHVQPEKIVGSRRLFTTGRWRYRWARRLADPAPRNRYRHRNRVAAAPHGRDETVKVCTSPQERPLQRLRHISSVPGDMTCPAALGCGSLIGPPRSLSQLLPAPLAGLAHKFEAIRPCAPCVYCPRSVPHQCQAFRPSLSLVSSIGNRIHGCMPETHQRHSHAQHR